VKDTSLCQKPEIVTVDTQIAHSEKRVADMTKTMDRVKKDEDRQAKSLEELEQGAADIDERKKEAAGMSFSFLVVSN
jgi:structural maintenance of chromosome 1